MKKTNISPWNPELPEGTLSGILGTLIAVIFIIACTVPAVSADETLGASFTFSPASPGVGESVTFSGSAASANITTWAWTFGDGETASFQSPTHSYTSAGSFSVVLTVTDAAGATDTATQSVTVTAASVPPDASFTFSPANPSAGESVTFTDTSTGDVATWSWAFGDGGVSPARNPSNTYAVAGTYTVTLAVSDGSGGTDTATQTITVAAAATVPSASFIYSPTTPAPGTQVTFTDLSTNSPTTWNWYFGDGGTSTEQNPIHTFTSAGTYTVSLTATNAAGSSTVYSRTVTVQAESVDADFSYSPSSPDAGEYVYFTDTSDGSPTGWEWDFGDTTGSELQNPSHKFTNDGTYSVKLTVTKAGATSDSVTKSITVGDATPTPTASPKPDAEFTWTPTSPTVGQAVSFTDTSSGTGITSWSWDFDDTMDFTGNRLSTLQNPTHTYEYSGSYDVTLSVTNSGGTDIVLKTVTVYDVQFNAQFNAYPSSGTAPLSVRFVDASTGADIESYSWDFGNGQTYSGSSPSTIVYSSAGTYTVSLEIEDESGATDKYTKTIVVTPPATAATVSQTALPTATPVPVETDTGFFDGEYRKMSGLYNEYIRIIFGFLGIDDEPDFLIIAVNNSQI